jgi:hypothetical protein
LPDTHDCFDVGPDATDAEDSYDEDYDDPAPFGFKWHDERERCRECYLSGTLENYYKGVSAHDLPDDYFHRDRWGRERCKAHHTAYLLRETVTLDDAKKYYKLYARDLVGVPHRTKLNQHNPMRPMKLYTVSALLRAQKVKEEKKRAKAKEREEKIAAAVAKRMGVGEEGGVVCAGCRRWFKTKRGL